MQILKRFFEDRKAVSPVIGVVLMVSITVILAAAIGSSVLSEGTTGAAPQANIHIKVDPDSEMGVDNKTTVILEHLGGDPITIDEGVISKIVTTVSGNSYTVEIENPNSTADITDTFVLEVGKTQKLILHGVSGDTINISHGDTVNIKIIDVATQQLICEKDLRF